MIVAPLEHLHRVALSIFVRAGSRYESVEDNGISHFFEHVVFRGTTAHPSAFELSVALEGLGGDVDPAMHADFTTYPLTLPPENLREGLEIFSEIFRRPIFRDFEVEKRIIREELLDGFDEEGRCVDVDDLLRAQCFPDHPLGFKLAGSIENVERFAREDLEAHRHRFYRAKNMVLCAAGPLDVETFFDEASRCFGDLPAGEEIPRGAPPGEPRERFVYVRDEDSQASLRLGFRIFGLRDARLPAIMLLERILDDGLSSRLHRRIIDEKGLAYECFAGMESYEECGLFELGATVEHEKCPEMVRELLGLIRDLREEPIGALELDRARNRFLWHLEATLDDAESMVDLLGTSALFRLRETLHRSASLAKAVQPSDLEAIARELLREDRAHLCCVGMLDDGLEAQTRRQLERAVGKR
ncbi:MAG: insulinase family protein [Myxococcales bacterium]|nr:insulinase family protein [Myxococcales bacterium]